MSETEYLVPRIALYTKSITAQRIFQKSRDAELLSRLRGNENLSDELWLEFFNGANLLEAVELVNRDLKDSLLKVVFSDKRDGLKRYALGTGNSIANAELCSYILNQSWFCKCVACDWYLMLGEKSFTAPVAFAQEVKLYAFGEFDEEGVKSEHGKRPPEDDHPKLSSAVQAKILTSLENKRDWVSKNSNGAWLSPEELMSMKVEDLREINHHSFQVALNLIEARLDAAGADSWESFIGLHDEWTDDLATLLKTSESLAK